MEILYVLEVTISVLFFLCLQRYACRNRQQEAVTLIKRKHAIQTSTKMQSKEERRILYLSQNGINYRMHRMVTSQEYLNLKILAGLACTIPAILAVTAKGPAIITISSVLAFLLGFYAPDLYFLLENHDDNRKILEDIHAVYDTLRVYLAVEVFITDALEECYRRVSRKRLKLAVYELKEGLKAQSEQLFEIEAFRNKFRNAHIDQLANLLAQYYKSGNVTTLMSDLSEQMVAIDHAINIRVKEKLERRAIMKEILVLIGMLGGIAVALLSSVGNMINNLF